MSKQRKSTSKKRAASRSLRTLAAAAAVTPLALGIPVAAHAVVAPDDDTIESRLHGQLGGENLKVGESVTVDLDDAFAEADSYLVYVQNPSVADVTTLNGDLYIGAKKEGTTLISLTAFDDEQHLVGDERFRLTVDANPGLDANGNGFDVQDAVKAVRSMTGMSDTVKKEATRTVLRSAESFLDLPNRGPTASANGEIVEIIVPEMSTHAVYLDEYFSDLDGDLLEYTAVNGLPSASSVGSFMLDAAGGKLHIHAFPYNSGSTTVTIRATDADGLSATQSFNLRLADINLAPYIYPIEDQVTNEDTAITLYAWVEEFDGDAVTLSAASDNPALIPDNRIEIMEANDSYMVVITPEPDQYGNAIITLTATDDTGLSSTQSFAVTVNQEDEAELGIPYKDPDASLSATVGKGERIVIDSSALSFLDTAESGPDNMTYTIVNLPQHGSLRLDDANLNAPYTFTQSDVNFGRLTFVHDGTESTSDGFAFQVSNGNGTTTELQFSVTIASFSTTSLVSELQSGGWMIRPDQRMIVDLEDLFTESDYGMMTYSITSDNTNSFAAVSGNLYSLNADRFTVTATDTYGAELNETFTVYSGELTGMHDVTIGLGDAGFETYVGGFFSVPSSQYVEYSIEVEDESIVDSMLEGEYLNISGLLAGTTTVTIRGTGINGNLAIVDSFDLHVSSIVVSDVNPIFLSNNNGTYYGDFDLNNIFANAVDYRFTVSSSDLTITNGNGDAVPFGMWRSEMDPALQLEHQFNIIATSPYGTITIEAKDAAGRIVSFKLQMDGV